MVKIPTRWIITSMTNHAVVWYVYTIVTDSPAQTMTIFSNAVYRDTPMTCFVLRRAL
jgi:hypothetical protein